MRYDREELQDEIGSIFARSREIEQRIDAAYEEVVDPVMLGVVDVVERRDIEPEHGNAREFGCLRLRYADRELVGIVVQASPHGAVDAWAREETLGMETRARAVAAVRRRHEEILDAVSEMEHLHLIVERDRGLVELRRLEAWAEHLAEPEEEHVDEDADAQGAYYDVDREFADHGIDVYDPGADRYVAVRYGDNGIESHDPHADWYDTVTYADGSVRRKRPLKKSVKPVRNVAGKPGQKAPAKGFKAASARWEEEYGN